MLAFLNPFVIRLHESNKYPRLPDTIKTRRHGITSPETSQDKVAFVVVVEKALYSSERVSIGIVER